ncbi:hypothetical protein RJ639_020002 [Escallonia herrerae]|uniref:Uncharacterized protein n=1 Tax=Escallonia herrerae TaxID=1293975 RepID=A0AA88V6Q5_9ASTE|nr:hypothetical protein RJ639_020002 [Escallonia herrerae]
MDNAKLVTIPLTNHFKLSLKKSHCYDEEIKNVPYALAVGSLIYHWTPNGLDSKDVELEKIRMDKNGSDTCTEASGGASDEGAWSELNTGGWPATAIESSLAVTGSLGHGARVGMGLMAVVDGGGLIVVMDG